MTLRESLKEYLDFINQTGYHYKTEQVLEMILDIDLLTEYCEKNNRKIGIVSRTPFNVHLIDLVRNSNGDLFPYERIVKAVQGNSVVIMPFLNGKIILLKQFRHALGDYQYALPRGYGELCLTPEENARKEINEELNCESGDYAFLGHIVADSGICGEKVNVFRCSIEKPFVEGDYESIVSYIEVTEDEFNEMIRSGQINDGFTLSAAALYNSRK